MADDSEHIQQVFVKINTNNDGKISEDEMAAYVAMYGHDPNMGRKLVRKLDENENGTVELEELVAGFERVLKLTKGVEFENLNSAVNSVWKAGKIPFVVDPSGKSDSFFSYNGNVIDAMGLFVLDKVHKKKTVDEISEEARKIVVASMKHGQPLNFLMRKGAPSIGEHLSPTVFPAELFKAGFGKDLAAFDKIIREVDKQDGPIAPKGLWDDFGSGLVVTTQFAPEDYKEFLLGAWADWPWDNFHEIIIMSEE
ncbi:hypothetical protein CYMTET_52148 [Cymbomonas tetramitiformis]|uniref:EF-hand domain-containing protein n=1 Tax=Cymbomonas tetramitiformis TaxID=36881 RepID=A0AAE0BL16_9CHLO|nr:hypothetical protein CYMTET_52148 [Cymbomonas tetramitiformis]|eukprot:gene20617-24718_t